MRSIRCNKPFSGPDKRFFATENPRLKPNQNGGLPNEYSSMHYADGGQYVSRDYLNDKAFWSKDTYLNPRMRDTNVFKWTKNIVQNNILSFPREIIENSI